MSNKCDLCGLELETKGDYPAGNWWHECPAHGRAYRTSDTVPFNDPAKTRSDEAAEKARRVGRVGHAGTQYACFDPSSENTGWAILLDINGMITRIASGIFHPSKAVGAQNRFTQLAAQVNHILSQYTVDDVLVEVPSGGQRQNARSLMTYAQAVGAVQAAAYIWTGIDPKRIQVNTWKRNRSKEECMAEVKYLLGYSTKNDNEADAIDMGIWWLRVGIKYGLDKVQRETCTASVVQGIKQRTRRQQAK